MSSMAPCGSATTAELGDGPDDRVVEAQPPVVAQLHDRRRGHRLADRGDPVQGPLVRPAARCRGPRTRRRATSAGRRGWPDPPPRPAADAPCGRRRSWPPAWMPPPRRSRPPNALQPTHPRPWSGCRVRSQRTARDGGPALRGHLGQRYAGPSTSASSRTGARALRCRNRTPRPNPIAAPIVFVTMSVVLAKRPASWIAWVSSMAVDRQTAEQDEDERPGSGRGARRRARRAG